MLGSELKLIRTRLKLENRELADLLALKSEQTIPRWEAGKAPVPEEFAERAEALRKASDDLLHGWMNRIGTRELEDRPAGPVVLLRYDSLEDYREANPDQGLHLPAAHVLHNATLRRLRRLEAGAEVRVVAYNPTAFKCWAEGEGRPLDPQARNDWAATQCQGEASEALARMREFQVPSQVPRLIRWVGSGLDGGIFEWLECYLPSTEFVRLQVAPRQAFAEYLEVGPSGDRERLLAATRPVGEGHWRTDAQGAAVLLWTDDGLSASDSAARLLEQQEVVRSRIRETVHQFSLFEAGGGSILSVFFLLEEPGEHGVRISHIDCYKLSAEVFYKDASAMRQGELTARMSMADLVMLSS